MIHTINDWKPEVRALLKRLVEHGCKLISGDNGEDMFTFNRLGDFIENLIACDEATLRVQMPDGQFRNLYLVLGNEPGVIVSDYHVHPLLDTITDEHYNAWENRPQPKLTGDYVGGKFRTVKQVEAIRMKLLREVANVIHTRNLYVKCAEGTRRVVRAIMVDGSVMVHDLYDEGRLYNVERYSFVDGSSHAVNFNLR